jgi:ABC-type glycerol-3-phosphate transport system substrate-binding protein
LDREIRRQQQLLGLVDSALNQIVDRGITKVSGYLPVRQSVMESPDFAAYLEEHPGFKVSAAQMEYGRYEIR